MSTTYADFRRKRWGADCLIEAAGSPMTNAGNGQTKLPSYTDAKPPLFLERLRAFERTQDLLRWYSRRKPSNEPGDAA